MSRIAGALAVCASVLLMLTPVTRHVNQTLRSTPSITFRADGGMLLPAFPLQSPQLRADGSMPPPPFPPQPLLLRADGSMPPPPFPPLQPPVLMADGAMPPPPFPPQPTEGAAVRV
jgi:hypothetical protein